MHSLRTPFGTGSKPGSEFQCRIYGLGFGAYRLGFRSGSSVRAVWFRV